MTKYELLQKCPDATRVLGSVEAGTMAQAERKLFRAHKVGPQMAQALGYKVQPVPKEMLNAHTA